MSEIPTLDRGDDDKLLDDKSHRPSYIINGVISTAGYPRTQYFASTLQRHGSPTFGDLDRLPLELLEEICSHLDLRSLARLYRVSLQTKQLVGSLLPLKKLLEHAKQAIPVLHKAEVLHLHSIDTLLRNLHLHNCSSCNAYGPFLHLILGVRVCYQCLVLNQSFWLISIPDACEAFSLDVADLVGLPRMTSIPGKYRAPDKRRAVKATKVLAVRGVKERAIAKYGSAGELDRRVSIVDYSGFSQRPELYAWYRRATVGPLLEDAALTVKDSLRPQDPFAGMSSVAWPSVHPDGRVERGHWCLECEYRTVDFACGEVDPEIVKRLVPEKTNPVSWFTIMQFKAYSREGFLAHLRDYETICRSNQRVARDL